ncbi:hypothetical protein [Evansella tamaricis]|uniref:Uncharacterized protein n=1 Tax=Evansella tamaricis TaxID=2069301 RepID=A0ABS6J9Y7_9BACI|nr:hypothetical protein [Evansella tamaricis]MBU9710496.1 hypothetical protein [Evansella tamaricis]
MSLRKHWIKLLALLAIFFIITVAIAGCFEKDGEKSEKKQEEEEEQTAPQDKDFDPMLLSGYEEIIHSFSDNILDLKVRDGQVVLLASNSQNTATQLVVGNLNNGMENNKVLDELPPLEKGMFSLSWVPDGKEIILIVKENDSWNLIKYNIESEEKDLIKSFETGISNVTFSGFENQLFYSQLLPNDTTQTTVRLNSWTLDAPMDIFQVSGNHENGPVIKEIAVSPDRNLIAYTLFREDENKNSLWLYDSTTNSSNQISTEGVNAGQPSWSEDGKLIAYTESLPDKGKAIYAYHQQNEQKWMVTKQEGLSFSPQWTQDNHLVFASKVLDEVRLYVMNFDEAYSEELVYDVPETQTYSTFDIAILNGVVVDPETETIKFGYNVGVKEGKIAAITKEDIDGETVIDADGNVVSPGFIDILSFNPNGAGEHFKVMDGVTTHLGMHGSGIEFESMFNGFERMGMVNHFGGAIQHSHMRTRLNIGPYDAPTEAQIEEMRKMTHRAAKEGAIGLSFSPEYYPGMTKEEIMAVMEVGKEYDFVSFFHVRYSTMFDEKTNIDALEEVIYYARELDVPVQVQHINSTGGTFSMEQSIAMIDEARAEGLDITLDVYPYNYWATWANTARFDDGFLERFQLEYSDLQVANTTERLTKESFQRYRSQRILLIAFGIPEEDVRLAMQPEYSMFGSDTIMVPPDFNNHPRGSGTFSRVYRKYVRETETIPFMKAVQMMTINPVNRLENVAHALQTKGRMQVGMDADITIFDFEKIEDTASPENVASFSEGVNYVLVDGILVKELEGIRKGVLPGKIIRSDFN